MPDWKAVSEAWSLDIPSDAVTRVAPALDSLDAAFRELPPKIPHSLDPAITLSEEAVKGE